MQKSESTKQLNINKIIKNILDGKKDEFVYIVENYKDMVMTTICSIVRNRTDAEDLSQEVFVKTYEKLHLYKKDFSFTTWLKKITINHCLNFIRKKQRFVELQDNSSLFVKGARENYTLKKEFNTQIDIAVKQLSPLMRIVVVLFHKEKKKYNEIAKILNMPEGTVKTLLHRARKFLAEFLKEYYYGM